MDLILWRHADAEDGADDLARRLTDRGERDAARVGAWLAGRLPRDARVLVSPAVRTQSTAAALKRSFETIPALAPGATAQEVLAIAGWGQGPELVVVVGHQPTMGRAASLALTGHAASWSVKKGALWWISTRDREEGAVIVRAVLSPEFA